MGGCYQNNRDQNRLIIDLPPRERAQVQKGATANLTTHEVVTEQAWF